MEANRLSRKHFHYFCSISLDKPLRLIKPDVPVSGIRLSFKGVHAFAHERLPVVVASRSRPNFRCKYMGA